MKERNEAKSAVPSNAKARHVAKVLLCDIVPLAIFMPSCTGNDVFWVSGKHMYVSFFSITLPWVLLKTWFR